MLHLGLGVEREEVRYSGFANDIFVLHKIIYERDDRVLYTMVFMLSHK